MKIRWWQITILLFIFISTLNTSLLTSFTFNDGNAHVPRLATEVERTFRSQPNAKDRNVRFAHRLGSGAKATGDPPTNSNSNYVDGSVGDEMENGLKSSDSSAKAMKEGTRQRTKRASKRRNKDTMLKTSDISKKDIEKNETVAVVVGDQNEPKLEITFDRQVEVEDATSTQPANAQARKPSRKKARKNAVNFQNATMPTVNATEFVGELANSQNFSIAEFFHNDPCNSTIKLIHKENITMIDEDMACHSSGLPIYVEPKIYKLQNYSDIFVHCENLENALSSSVAKTGLNCESSNDAIVAKNATVAMAPLMRMRKRRNRKPSCAIIGSSSMMLGADYGSRIDRYDLVIRLNQAPTSGSCATHVGKKTSIRMLNGRWTYKYAHHDRFPFLPLEKNVLLVISRSSGNDYSRLITKLSEIRPDVKVRMLSRGVVGSAQKLLQHYRMLAKTLFDVKFGGGNTPSSGLLALVLALNVCRNVSAYGFGTMKRASLSTHTTRKFYHYFSHMMGQQAMDDVHSFRAESAMLASFGRTKRIKFCGLSKNYTFNVTLTPEEETQ